MALDREGPSKVVRPQIVLDGQKVADVTGTLGYEPHPTRDRWKADAAADAMQHTSAAVLVEMHESQHRDLTLCGKSNELHEGTTYGCVSVSVDGADVGGQRIQHQERWFAEAVEGPAHRGQILEAEKFAGG